MVFYRKYRPQTIDDLDSKPVREGLTAVLSLPEPPHAFLFTGPKGLGKTSTARIFAKVINCANKKKGSLEPCNTCDTCISITNGSNVDITEIDGASNRNIDDVRDLKEKIKLSPASVKKKVYIIDEVHMFTTESFNALLKTLEEPPSHAMFILCTTEKQKVPATIASRCFLIQFQPATKEEIARSFKRIAAGESISIDDEAITEIAELADGGFRDAHKILEELVASAKDNKITKALVEERFKTTSTTTAIMTLIQQLLNKDTKAALQSVTAVVEQGIDMKFFLFQLASTVHIILLQKAGVVDTAQFSTDVTLSEVKELLLLVQRAHSEIKHAVLPQIPLEMAIIEWGQPQTVIPADLPAGRQGAGISSSLSEDLRADGQEAATHGSPIPPSLKATEGHSGSGMTYPKVEGNGGVTVASMRKQVGDLARVKALYGEPKPVPRTENAEREPSIDLTQISNTEITPQWLQHFWNSFIIEIKLQNHTLAGVLRGCTIKSFDKKSLIIETAYKFHKERLDDGKTMPLLIQACKTLTGNSVAIEVRLKS
jgi:DNA polymerase III subunit gamma/tau